MKTLLILRHAKAASDRPIADHERPLTVLGESQAREVGRWLRGSELTPGVIVSSTAVRARCTAELVAAACGYYGKVQATDALYGAVREIEIQQMVHVLHGIDEAGEPAMIVGHNPDLERLIAALTRVHERLSTATVAQLELNIARWADLQADGQHTLVRVRNCPQEL